MVVGVEKAGCHVVGVRRSFVVLEVAGNTRGTAEVVIAVDMAIRAQPWGNGVSARQRKSHRSVVEFGVEPVVGSVARVASGGEFSGNVIGTDGGLEIG